MLGENSLIFGTPMSRMKRWIRNSWRSHSRIAGWIPVALALAPLSSQPQQMPGNTDRQTGDVAALVRQGTELAARGDFAEAEVPLKQALALAPENFSLLRTLGKVEARLGHMDESIALLRTAVGIAPDDAQAHVELGIALADADQRSDALREFTDAERLQPDSATAHLNRARVLDDMGNAAEAETEFSTSLRLSPKNPDVYYYWALLEREQGRLPKEAELLSRLTRLKPQDDRAFYLLGRSLADQGRHREAVSALRTAIGINPRSSSALYLLSRELRTTNPAEAESLSRRFMELRQQGEQQEGAIALGNEALAAFTQQDWPKAIRLLHQAIAQCNGCSIEAGLRKNLGLTLCRNGQLDEGAVELHKSLKLNPSDPDVLKALTAIGR